MKTVVEQYIELRDQIQQLREKQRALVEGLPRGRVIGFEQDLRIGYHRQMRVSVRALRCAGVPESTIRRCSRENVTRSVSVVPKLKSKKEAS